MLKSLFFGISAAVLFTACAQKSSSPANSNTANDGKNFGTLVTADKAVAYDMMLAKMGNKDSMSMKVVGKVKEVCQKKGCWMNLALTDKEAAFVKFKDYGFFMPLNSKGAEVIVHGKAFVSVESIEELKHYAKDAGKSQAAIDSIVAPEVTYSFEANGVLLKQ